MTGDTKQLLSDKLNQGNRKQDVKKPLRHTGHALNQLFMHRTTGKEEKKNLEPTLEQSFEVHHESEKYNSKGLGLSRFGGGLGERCAHFMEIDLLEIHHHGNRDLGQEF